METYVRSPREVFHQPQHFNVPLFQRRYVWQQDDQWAPLWADVRRTAELLLAGNAGATHFLGAIVLQSQGPIVGTVPQWSVIDGQQRLTTLQLLMDATAALFEDRGEQKLANRLYKLTHNDEDEVDADQLLKVRHSNADGAAYQEVMDAPAPIDYDALDCREDRVAQAHAFFGTQVAEWLDHDWPETPVSPAEALADAMMMALQLVVITLRADEDSQEIFETLNARGTPLTAADLIKNLLFQRLVAQGGDAGAAYRDYWRMFETSFWEKEVSVGRLLMPRSAVFLGQWLVSRTGEDISARSTFTRFKHFVDHEYPGATIELLRLIHEQAQTYAAWTRDAESKNPNIDTVARAVYRMNAVSLEVAKPVLIWLYEPDNPIPADEVEIALSAVESWLMRRMMLRLTTADLGRVVALLIANYRSTPSEGLGSRVRDQLARQTQASSYWPGDDDVRQSLSQAPAYRSFGRPRLRMMLEAVEDARRGYADGSVSRTGSRITRGGMHIEHVLPQRWERHWPVPDLAAKLERESHVHRLGNLTLLTQKLNGEVSNGPWDSKRAALEAHDVNLITRDVRLVEGGSWDEGAIDSRGADMVEALLQTWPVPQGHIGHVESRAPSQDVALPELVAAGLIAPGSVLSSRGMPTDGVCVTEEGLIEHEGHVYETPSGAAWRITGRGSNGWSFWSLPDGRRLMDVRADYLRGRDVHD